MQWHSMLASAIVKQEKCRTVSVCFAVRWSYHPQAYDAKWGNDSLSARTTADVGESAALIPLLRMCKSQAKPH